jgi:predicted RNA-binding Zn ribbon-like protein
MGEQAAMADRPWTFHLSGCLALDLANTISWRASDTPIERLASVEDYIRWAKQSRLISDRETRELTQQARRRPAEAAAAIAQVRRLREAIYRVLSALADRADPDERDLATLNVALSEAMRHLRISRRADGSFVSSWEEGAPSLSRLVWPAVKSAADVLTSSNLRRLKKCGSDDCGWLFLDTTRSGTRRWCDMRVCGNRAKAHRYYHRRRLPRKRRRSGS